MKKVWIPGLNQQRFWRFYSLVFVSIEKTYLISKTRDSVSWPIRSPQITLKLLDPLRVVFSTFFSVFVYLDERCLSCLINTQLITWLTSRLLSNDNWQLVSTEMLLFYSPRYSDILRLFFLLSPHYVNINQIKPSLYLPYCCHGYKGPPKAFPDAFGKHRRKVVWIFFGFL